MYFKHNCFYRYFKNVLLLNFKNVVIRFLSVQLETDDDTFGRIQWPLYKQYSPAKCSGIKDVN
jgi:hypothetical protein